MKQLQLFTYPYCYLFLISIAQTTINDPRSKDGREVKLKISRLQCEN
jgi:hypothetical protein